MRMNSFRPVLLACIFVGAQLGCGDDGGAPAGDDDDTGTGGAEVTSGPGSMSSGDGDGDGDEAGDGASHDDDHGDGDSSDDGEATDDGAGGCQVWEITYDLTGSEFEIADTPLGAGNQVNVVAEPYTDDDHVGPGSFVLRFRDVGGEPGGDVFMHAYQMSLHFVVGGSVTVATDIETEAGPVDCGITSGTLDGTTVSWIPSAIVDLHRQGQILCTGTFCSLGGLPNGEPQPVDETEDQPLSAFEFSGELDAFTMAKTVIQQDDNSTTTWTYVGTEVGRELIAAPACLCD
jgi:hypothetical protein